MVSFATEVVKMPAMDSLKALSVKELRQHRIIGDEDHRESAVGQKSGSIPEYPL